LVYFIQMGEDGPIKIGFTLRGVESRQRTLAISSPFELRVLGVLNRRGTKERERELHAQFRHAHMRGEWFRPEPDLVAFITSHAAQPQPATKKPKLRATTEWEQSAQDFIWTYLEWKGLNCADIARVCQRLACGKSAIAHTLQKLRADKSTPIHDDVARDLIGFTKRLSPRNTV
jgi:hypothetical protein